MQGKIQKLPDIKLNEYFFISSLSYVKTGRERTAELMAQTITMHEIQCLDTGYRLWLPSETYVFLVDSIPIFIGHRG